MDAANVYRHVQEHYGEIANHAALPNLPDKYQEKVATAFGYTLQDIRSIPGNANLGVSCGNPLATANVKTGETVIDLGCGGGIDVLLSAAKVGPDGRAVGIDMTKNMLDLARRNAEKAGVSNASFIEASITSIPLDSSIADCIISNCVINLVPKVDKPLVFAEIFRLLKPGGRVAISDILAKKEFPREVREDLSLYVGCIAGASQVHDYEQFLKDAGFLVVSVLNTNSDLNLYKNLWQAEKNDSEVSSASCCRSHTGELQGRAKSMFDFNEWAGSFQVYAIKPK
ncbi:S-adenosyl-L-methionine-dependent methyltransferase [Lipomyces chichibuensis]|uniref:S-adenosyl-L-methionine-dependent methyltransferase n=1 Tax=Lipomyces chichibuensis TaxID=1546026 RepID=UPI0033433818